MELKIIGAEHVAWDTFVIVYSGGVRQQCSREKYEEIKNKMA